MTAVGCDAAPVVLDEAAAVVLPELAPPVEARVGGLTVEMVVVFRAAEMLALTDARTLDKEAEAETEGAGVVDAAIETGYSWGRLLLTSEGSAWYHSGVWPAARAEASEVAKAAVLEAAWMRTEAGMAVTRTERMDEPRASVGVGMACRSSMSTFATAPAAPRARSAKDLSCMVICERRVER